MNICSCEHFLIILFIKYDILFLKKIFFDIIISMNKADKNVYQRNFYGDEDSSFVFLLTLILPSFIAMVIISLIAIPFGISNIQENTALMVCYIILANLCMVGIFFLYNKGFKINFVKASLIKFKFGWLNVLYCCLIAVITLFGSLYLINYLMYLMQQIGYNPDSSLPFPLTNGWWLILNLFLLAVLPAICEELLYRGVVFNGLRKFGSVGAVLISALFFALAHGSAMQFFYQFILGVVLALVVLKTGSIIASMVVHFLNNAIVVVYNYITINLEVSETNFTVGIIFMAFGVAVVAAGLLWLIFKFMKEKKGDELTDNQRYYENYALSDKKFSSKRSMFLFILSVVLAVVLWCVGTFAS